MPVGSVFGNSMAIRLLRLLLPEIKLTWLLLTPQKFARYFSRYWLSLPSTGGAVRRIFRRSPYGPAISSRLARGWTQISSISTPFFQQYHVLGIFRRGSSPCQLLNGR